MFDVTREESFENTTNWLRQIEIHCQKGVQKVLVANKVDMEDQRVITRDQGEKMAEEYNMAYIETSAKTGEGCTESFENMAEILVKIRMEDEAMKAPKITADKNYEYDGRSFSLQ